jgi:O-methyltransferase involved in polyketide biosynthesis
MGGRAAGRPCQNSVKVRAPDSDVPDVQGLQALMQKLQADDLTGVSETLLIPLHYRVAGSRASSGPYKDDMAERFHDAIAYEWEKFQDSALQQRAIVARTTILDDQAKAFVSRHPDGLIVNLGAGLDTRFYRLYNGTIRWIELDLPDVIAFRQKLREPANPRHIFLAASVLDDRWLADVKGRARSRILFIAEGLFPYFTEQQHREIFGRLADHFPGQEMLFQTSAPSVLQGLVQYSDLGKLRTNVDIQWGLEESAQVSSLNPKVQFVSEFPLLTDYEKLPPQIRRRLTPDQMRKAGKIVHVRFA